MGLRWIDEANRSEHWLLEREDHCLFLGEYLPGGGWTAGPTNSLVLDFKRAPSRIRASRRAAAVAYFKERAIEAVGCELRRGFGRAAVERSLTFVPMPTSKRPGEGDYCDRLLRALRFAFAGWDADLRPLLRISAPMAPDHDPAHPRLRHRELLRLMEVDGAQLARPLRPVLVLFDDVLVSGKHLSAAKACIRDRCPAQPIIAVFVARVSRRLGASTPIAG